MVSGVFRFISLAAAESAPPGRTRDGSAQFILLLWPSRSTVLHLDPQLCEPPPHPRLSARFSRGPVSGGLCLRVLIRQRWDARVPFAW